jgi:hypothetical protein
MPPQPAHGSTSNLNQPDEFAPYIFLSNQQELASVAHPDLEDFLLRKLRSQVVDEYASGGWVTREILKMWAFNGVPMSSEYGQEGVGNEVSSRMTLITNLYNGVCFLLDLHDCTHLYVLASQAEAWIARIHRGADSDISSYLRREVFADLLRRPKDMAREVAKHMEFGTFFHLEQEYKYVRSNSKIRKTMQKDAEDSGIQQLLGSSAFKFNFCQILNIMARIPSPTRWKPMKLPFNLSS